MANQNLSYEFTVTQSPEDVFAAINNVRAWWSGDIEGDTDRLGSEWTYRYQDLHYSKQRIIELRPGMKVVWRVLESALNFIEDKNEWQDTEIVFEITREDDKTQLRFTHVGLVPNHECYSACSNAWGSYVTGSLRNLIAQGAVAHKAK